MPTVSVKWQKELFPAVEIDTDQPPLVFKCQLFDLTGVPPDRQKIMVKGGLLKDDGDWAKIGVKDGQRLMMMGTADVLPEPPKEKPVFLEDLPEEMQDTLHAGYTAGLKNLGNTCYMNSTLQCLHSVPELKLALQIYSPSFGAPSSETDVPTHLLTVATRDIFEELDRSSYPVAPNRFLTVLRNKFPQFSQQDRQTGMFMQQDAEECWTQLVYNLSKGLRTPMDEGAAVATVKLLFGIDFHSKVKCAESGEESSDAETVYTLKCHISVGVNHLVEGLKAGLVSEIEKNSPLLGRSALYVKESLIGSLPQYLTVQFVRFFWKRESGKAKILRKVDYPLVLDVLEFCTDELKEKLKDPRKRLQELEDAKAGLKKDAKGKEGLQDLTGLPSSSGEAGPVDGGQAQLTGIYDLVSVLTHKGRSADSGHYVAWVKQESGKWIEFDDDNPIPQREEDITKLSGGGDWHMAYICLYKARVVPPQSGNRSNATS